MRHQLLQAVLYTIQLVFILDIRNFEIDNKNFGRSLLLEFTWIRIINDEYSANRIIYLQLVSKNSLIIVLSSAAMIEGRWGMIFRVEIS